MPSCSTNCPISINFSSALGNSKQVHRVFWSLCSGGSLRGQTKVMRAKALAKRTLEKAKPELFASDSPSIQFRRSLMFIVFLPNFLLGQEMAAPILWAPDTFRSFLQENLHAHIICRFRGVFCLFLGRGGKCPIYFYGRGDFSDQWSGED